MNIFKKFLIGLITLFSVSSYANNGIGLYSNDLAKCMVSSLSNNDKKTIQEFVLQSIFTHPNFSHKNPFSHYEMVQNNQKLGQLITRLVSKDCNKEYIIAIHYDKEDSIVKSFEILSQYAFQDLGGHPNVQSQSSAAIQYIDIVEIEKAIRKTLSE